MALMLLWLSLLLIPLLLLFRKVKELKRQNKQLPPGPPTLPILGNIHQLGALPYRSYKRLTQKYGPVMLLKLGRIPVVIISSAEAAREVLKVHDLECCSRPPLTGFGKLSYNYLDVAFSPYSEYWREMRKICVLELFSLKRLQSFRFIREEEVGLLMNSISHSSSSATPVNLSEKLHTLNANIVFRMAFGRIFRESSFDGQRFRQFVDATKAVAGSFSAEECFSYIGWMIDWLKGYHAKVDKVCQEMDTILQHIINDHLKPETESTKQEQEDIVDVMLKLQRDQTEQSGRKALLTTNHIKAVLMNILLPGIDSSSTPVVWAMSELVRNPRTMYKAQEEVRNCIGKKGIVTEDDIDKLVYLKLIIKETLRLHPPGPLLLPRETMSHFKLNGYDILPKTTIHVNVWAIGRDTNYWERAEEFFPERFEDNSFDFIGQHFQFLPFGSGRRICPGMHMGLASVELALANLLYCFDWKLPNGMNSEQDLNMDEAIGQSFALSKKIPLTLVPVKH